jgi:hypothetical protein
MYLQGPARGDHKFTVASMVSRRAGRTFSDLVCGTGVPSSANADLTKASQNREVIAFCDH